MFAELVIAQETVTLKFTTSSLDGYYVNFDAINVTNITRGWSDVLAYPDTTMALTSYSGLQESSNKEGFLSDAYPNPFSGQTYVLFRMDKSAFVNARLLDINGGVLFEYNDYMDEGVNQIRITVQKPQMAFLVVKTNMNQYVKKMLNVGSGFENNITFTKVSDLMNMKSATEVGEFVIGDVMRYEAVSFATGSMVLSDVVTQTQYSSETIVLTFPLSRPLVITYDISQVSTHAAVAGGAVTSDGGGNVNAKGVCWSTSPYPTINDLHTIDGSGTGVFTSNLTGLSFNTTYFVRAYATNEVGTTYGEQKSFTTDLIPGAIDALYSISAEQQVYFSMGNLQYRASTNTWRFAENQWDYVGSVVVQTGETGGTVSGSSNHLISSTYNGWIDLFGWGTSGYDHGAVCFQPWSVSTQSSDYNAYGDFMCNLNDQTGKADWGRNAIDNGGNVENLWRTLTDEEWNYLLNVRNTTSGIRCAKSIVNGVNGLIILPDNWNSDIYSLNNINSSEANFNSNTISEHTWTSIFDVNGAVFLPAAGGRSGTNIRYLNYYGRYWSSTANVDYFYRDEALCLYFDDSHIESNTFLRSFGQSVRLVCQAE